MPDERLLDLTRRVHCRIIVRRHSRRNPHVTDGASEESGVGESGNWRGAILEIGAEVYEVQLSGETDGDGCVYLSHAPPAADHL